MKYKETDVSSYDGVNLFCQGGDIVFNTGDFPTDYFLAKHHFVKNIPEGEPLCLSSSVDHFIMDGAKFDSAYLVFDTKTGKSELRYGKEFSDEGWEFFVPEGGQPTWDELKNRVRLFQNK